MAYKDKQTRKNKNFREALGHACSGVKIVLLEERNLKIHLMFGTIAVVLALLLQFTKLEWLALILTISLVIILEMINTLIENLVDLVTDGQYHPLAKKAKDIGAGIVLTASVMAVIIGLILFVPKILR